MILTVNLWFGASLIGFVAFRFARLRRETKTRRADQAAARP